MQLDAVEERLFSTGPVVNVMEQGLVHHFRIGAFQIVVPIDHVKSSGLVEFVHAPEDVGVGGTDIGEVFVLVQLVAIPSSK